MGNLRNIIAQVVRSLLVLSNAMIFIEDKSFSKDKSKLNDCFTNKKKSQRI